MENRLGFKGQVKTELIHMPVTQFNEATLSSLSTVGLNFTWD